MLRSFDAQKWAEFLIHDNHGIHYSPAGAGPQQVFPGNKLTLLPQNGTSPREL